MPVSPITNVLKTEAFLGKTIVNHRERGYTYHHYIPATDDLDAANKLAVYCGKLRFVIPIGSEIVESVVYQPDATKFGLPAIAGKLSTRCTDIIPPDPDAEADDGYVPNDPHTCLLINLDTLGWTSREFFRTPPDNYIVDGAWTGPTWAQIASGTVLPAFTVNPSVSPTKVDGTWLERVRDLYKYVFDTFQYEWRPHPTDADSIQISPFRFIYMRRPTKRKMGRAYLPDRRK